MSALRELLAHFGVEVDTKQVEHAHEGIEGLIGKLQKLAGVLAGAFVAKEAFEFVHALTEQAEALEQQAEAFGLSTTEMQQWQGAANIAGVKTEYLDNAFKIMAKNVGKGTGPAVEQLAKLGVKVKDAEGNVRPLGDLFEDAGEAIGTLENAGQRAAAGQAVFGRQFTKIIPLIKEGREGMAKLRGEVTALGGGMDEAFIQKSHEMNANLARLRIWWMSLKVTVAAELLPPIMTLVEWLVKLTAPFLELIKSTSIIQTALVTLGAMGFAALSAAIGPLEIALVSLGRTFLTTILPLLVLEDFITFLRGGDSEFGRMIDALFGKGSADKFRAWMKAVLDGVADLREDWDDLVVGAKILWTEFSNAALMAVAKIETFFSQLWAKILEGWKFVRAQMRPDGAMAKLMGDQWKKEDEELDKTIADFAAGSSDENVVRSKMNADRKAILDEADARKMGRKLAALGINDPAAAMALAQGGSTPTISAQNALGTGTRVPDFTTTNNTEINVHVAPGTPEQQARALGKAAADGAEKGTQTKRATHAAVTQGKG